jgi:hypothetical protein
VVGLVGDEVLVAGGFECGDVTARSDSLLLDPSTGEWRPAASAPSALHGSDRYGEPSNGRVVFAIDQTGSPAVYDGVTDRWHRGPAHPLGDRYTETPWAWVNGRLLAFSGGLTNGEGGCCEPVEGGYAYTTAWRGSAARWMRGTSNPRSRPASIGRRAGRDLGVRPARAAQDRERRACRGPRGVPRGDRRYRSGQFLPRELKALNWPSSAPPSSMTAAIFRARLQRNGPPGVFLK